MRRWIVPLVAVVVIAAASAGAVWWPVQNPDEGAAVVDDARISLVCPSVSGSGVNAQVAAVSSTQPVRIAALGKPEGAPAPGLLATVAKPSAFSVVAALRSDTSGAVSWVSAPGTSEQGLSGASCQTPGTQQWFTGVELTTNTQADLVLANADATDASVGVTMWTDKGVAVAAGLGDITVPAGQSTTVPLNIKYTSSQPVALSVEASSGRVAAFLRQHYWQGSQPRGADWIPPGTQPATTQVLPGLPSGTGLRKLVLANPGANDAVVGVDLLGASGTSALAGANAIDVPAQSVVAVDLTTAIAQQPGALLVTSTGDITAGMIASEGSATAGDPAFLASGVPLGDDGWWPVPAGKTAAGTLLLTNAGAAQATVVVTLASAPGKGGTTTTVPLPASTTVSVPLPKQDVTAIRVQTSATTVYAGVSVTDKVGSIAGLATLPLVSLTKTEAIPPISYDPRVGA